MVPTVALVTLPKACAALRIGASASSSSSAAFLPAAGTIASSSDRRSFMSISVSPFSSATRNATFSTPSCTSLRSSIRDSSSGPISVTVARTGWPCSPNTSQNTVENWSGWNARPISVARLRMKSLASPTSAMPERSPLMSAANTGTPARANPSAITCSETVLPVPVAPVTRPWRLASPSVSQAGCSPLPMNILSAVSAILLSDVAIASPLRAPTRLQPGFQSPDAIIILHLASRLKPFNASLDGLRCRLVRNEIDRLSFDRSTKVVVKLLAPATNLRKFHAPLLQRCNTRRRDLG